MDLRSLSPGRRLLVRLVTWTTIIVVYLLVTFSGAFFFGKAVKLRHSPSEELEQRVENLEKRIEALEKDENP